MSMYETVQMQACKGDQIVVSGTVKTKATLMLLS